MRLHAVYGVNTYQYSGLPRRLYTFYCVRWATQKRDILRVCVCKVAHRGGVSILLFWVCVRPTSCVPPHLGDFCFFS